MSAISIGGLHIEMTSFTVNGRNMYMISFNSKVAIHVCYTTAREILANIRDIMNAPFMVTKNSPFINHYNDFPKMKHSIESEGNLFRGFTIKVEKSLNTSIKIQFDGAPDSHEFIYTCDNSKQLNKDSKKLLKMICC